jgi:trans-aconitate 2-methyltransferase
MTADWNADAYHRVSEPQRLWGEKVLASLSLGGDEIVLDAGCGTGRLTRKILERLDRGRVLALDSSPNMLEVAKRELAEFGDRVSFVRAELARDALPSGVDLVFSTATFHWVHDHDALFRTIADALVPGGRLHAQCGGKGNLIRAHALTEEIARADRYAAHLTAMDEPWNFAGVEETTARLKAAGFTDLDVSLEDAPTPFESAAHYAEFVRTVVLRPFLAELPADLHDPFVAEVTARAANDVPPLTLDYVRLNLRAKRAA